MGTLPVESSIPELVEQSQRLRNEFDHHVTQLRVTLDRSRIMVGDCGWPQSQAPASQPETASNHLLGGLTRREIEVLRLIAEGKSSKEIAAELGIAFRTAVCHRYRIFQKLNVHETASVVRIAIRAGLVQP